MAIFAYTVKNKEGKSFSGTVEAPTTAQAASILRDRGWVVTSIFAKENPGDIAYWIKKIRRVGDADKVFFTRQLAMMMEAGLPLADTLEILGKQTKNARLQEVLQSAKRDIEGGATLSASLSKFPDIFENIYISLIKAGEASGNLDKTLLRLSENAEKKMEFSGAFKQAMIYPIIVLIAMAGVFVIMVVVVLPKLAEMYKDLGVDLPLPTKIMLGASDFIINFWWLAIIITGGIVGAFYYFANTTFGIYKLAEVSLKAPIFGKLNRDSDMGQFARTLSLLVSSGLPFLQCLDIVSGTITNIIYRDAIKEAAKQVERGVNLSVPLRANPLFPPVLSQMIVVGEETGKMDEVLLKVSSFFEKDVEKSLKNLTSALEPIIMIVLGVVVGVLIFSIITPIYKLTSSF